MLALGHLPPILSFSSLRLALLSFKLEWLSLTEKNMGPASANQNGSTAETHCMYSLLVITSSW